LSRRSLPSARQGHAHQQLGHGHGGDGDVVVIGDDRIQISGAAFGIDQEGRVHQQPAQCRSSTDSSLRVSASSSAQPASGSWRRKAALAASPRPRPAGSSCAITLPRRTMR
jgi:hypothetical protein